jgi:dTDP-glucose 4,6-dehydratase/UDP-glucose 4-epimerase
LRIFSAYGEGLKKQLFWDLNKKTRSDKEIELFGTGEETRDFIYIKDLVNLIDLVCKKADFTGETINAANGVEVPIKEVVEQFYKNFPQSIKFSFGGNPRKGDPSKWVADISRIKELGYVQHILCNKDFKITITGYRVYDIVIPTIGGIS